MGFSDEMSDMGSNTGEFGARHKGHAKKGFDNTKPKNQDHEDFVDEAAVVKRNPLDGVELENPRHDRDMK